MLDKTEPEECASEPEGAAEYTTIDGSVLINSGDVVNWNAAQTTVGPASYSIAGSSFSPQKDETDSPDKVLSDHLNYLNERKIGYEKLLGELTKRYAATENNLNSLQSSIEVTEKAINQLKETTNK